MDAGKRIELGVLIRRAIEGDHDTAATLGLTPAPGESDEDFALRCWQILDPEGPPPHGHEQ